MSGVKFDDKNETKCISSYILRELDQWIKDNNLPFIFKVTPISSYVGCVGTTGCIGSTGVIGSPSYRKNGYTESTGSTELTEYRGPRGRPGRDGQSKSIHCNLENMKICGQFTLPRVIAEIIIKPENFVYTINNKTEKSQILLRDNITYAYYKYGHYKKEGLEELLALIQKLDTNYNVENIQRIELFNGHHGHCIPLTQKLPYKGTIGLVEEINECVRLKDPNIVICDIQMLHMDLEVNFENLKKMLFEASFHLVK